MGNGRYQRAGSRFGNVRFGTDKDTPRNPNNPFVRPAANAGRQLGSGHGGYVRADDGEVAVFEFEDVRAARQGRRLLAVGVRIRAESSFKHTEHYVTVVSYPVNRILS